MNDYEYSRWMAMDEPVASAMAWAGPDGWMEFEHGDTGRWRMCRPAGYEPMIHTDFEPTQKPVNASGVALRRRCA